jgi:hypothetical protein
MPPLLPRLGFLICYYYAFKIPASKTHPNTVVALCLPACQILYTRNFICLVRQQALFDSPVCFDLRSFPSFKFSSHFSLIFASLLFFSSK